MPSLSLTLLPKVIQRFRRENPDAAISIHTNDSPMVAHWAASQFCHVGLASYVGDEMPGVRTQKICDVPGVCIFPTSHRLSARATVKAEDLHGEELISLSMNDDSRARVDRAFAGEKEYRKLNLETSYASTVCSLVALGLGVSIVSRWLRWNTCTEASKRVHSSRKSASRLICCCPKTGRKAC